jgi:tetratricopeptide (TPR) repeat protein
MGVSMKKALVLACAGILYVAFSTGAHASTRAVINANAAGNRAYDARNFELALGRYRKALQLAEKSNDLEYRAIALYGMAQASAQLCKIAEADALFRQSIALREGFADHANAYITQNWIEYGRFLFTNNHPAEATTHFAKALPKLESLGIQKTDPIGYAEFLDTYVAALKAAADTELARTLELKASELRARYPGQVAHFKPDGYPADCK